jgi:DNA helicase-2/ATP-dependent DNA helicase PcrA
MEALSRTGKTEKDFPYLKTIHSICYRSLNINHDQIIRPDGLTDFARKTGTKLSGALLDPWLEGYGDQVDSPTRDDYLISANHLGRHRKIGLKEALTWIPHDIDFMYAQWFTRAYREWKESRGLLDYTDLLGKYIEYGRPLPIDVIFIDEAQDLSHLQWEAVWRLGSLAQRWYIAGDDDQAIFNWAGADSSVFQDLVADRIEILDQSYRVSKAVHRLATRITQRIKKRLVKEYAPTESEGLVAESGYLTTMDFSEKSFILFRNHYRGVDIGYTLRCDYVPYVGKGSPFYDQEIRYALLAYYQLMKKGETSSALAKTLNRFTDKNFVRENLTTTIKEKKMVTVEDVFYKEPKPNEWAKVFSNLPKVQDIIPYVERHGMLRCATPKVELLSIHQAKGREAHTVYIDPEMSKATWLSMLERPDDEHRVFYVGITRAKERVFFLLPDGNYHYKF